MERISGVEVGEGSLTGSTSSSVMQMVNKDDSSTSLSSSMNPSSFGQPVTFTAVVSTSMPSSGTPTGTMQFKDGVTNLGSPVTLSSGTAKSSSISSLTVCAHNITAVYYGNAIFPRRPSPPLTPSLTRHPAPATTLSHLMVLPTSPPTPY